MKQFVLSAGDSLLNTVVPMGGQASPKSTLSANRINAMHTKLEMMRAQADEAQKNADKSRERQLEANRQLMETIVKLQKFNAEEATQKAVLDILLEGIKQFSALKTQWSKLLLFFTDISVQIRTGMGKPLENFVKHSKIIKDYKVFKDNEMLNIHPEYNYIACWRSHH